MAKRKQPIRWKDRILRLERVRAGDIQPHPQNPRTHGAKQMNVVLGSLSETGKTRALYAFPADGKGAKGDFSRLMYYDGHGRVALDPDEIWPVLVTDLTAAEVYRELIIGDASTGLAEYDANMLEAVIREAETTCQEVADFITEIWEENQPDPEQPEPPEEDEPPEPQAEAVTHPGDLWTLGRHRVLCGDSTKAADVERVMGGEKIELLMIDPPYGINASSMTMGSTQSSLPKAQRLSAVKQWDQECPNVSGMVAIATLACVWGGQYFASQLPVSDDWLCWYKKNDNLSFGEFELAWTNFGKRCRHISHHWGAEKKAHITQKPVGVIAWAIQQAHGGTGIVADFFLGSGTTLMACHHLDRTCIGIEISDQYVDVCCQRWINKYGSQPVLQETGETFDQVKKRRHGDAKG